MTLAIIGVIIGEFISAKAGPRLLQPVRQLAHGNWPHFRGPVCALRHRRLAVLAQSHSLSGLCVGLMAGVDARAGGRMTPRRGISRRGVLAGAAAGALLLPRPGIAQPAPSNSPLPWLAQGSFAYVYVARAKGIMKARGIDFDIARGFGSMASAQAVAAASSTSALSRRRH